MKRTIIALSLVAVATSAFAENRFGTKPNEDRESARGATTTQQDSGRSGSDVPYTFRGYAGPR
jgi:uncharacterized protein YdeI (BOF family)